jgi:hypothetical protein
MPSEAYQLFLDSMVMDFDKWHDGTGYALKALEQLGPEERDSIEKLLVGNLKQAGDWRDVEALAALGTDSACAAVNEARFHNDIKVRKYALRIYLDTQDSKDMTKKDIADLEEQVVQAVKHGDFEIAEYMPTMRVKKALLDSILGFKSEIRVSAVAFLLYLCGQAPEPFDWSQRPFFLLFSDSERDPKMLQHAWEHLRKRTGL